MPRPRAGFTLVELLIVVVIIGILTAISIPRFQTTKGKANAAALRSDLRNLVVAQEAYFYEKQQYADDQTLLNYRGSPGVVITLSAPTGAASWVATATHPLSYPLMCTVYMGAMTPPPPTENEGVPACR